MPGKRMLWMTMVLSAVMSATGCCAWCDRWCAPRQSVYAAPAAAAPACCVPICCTPAGSGYAPAAPATTWSAPRGAACQCP